MIIANVDIRDGIVNGSLGTVIDFVKVISKNEKGEDIEVVKSIIVVFDDPETGLDLMNANQWDENVRIYKEQRGVPIPRSNLMYQVPYKRNYKEHGSKCQLRQFPLKLAWASTGHKIQGITIKKGTNIVIHGHEKIPAGMYYLMLSRAEEIDQIYIEMPNLKDKKGKVKGKLKLQIKANPSSLQQNESLVQRSIVPSYKENHFSVFMINIDSLQNKIIDLKDDIYAQVSDHICIVETWLDPNLEYNIDIPGRHFDHVAAGIGKGCGIFSLVSRQLSQSKHKLAREKYQLMSIIDETNPRNPYQLVLIYASSGCPFQNVVLDLQNLLHPKMISIIIGDFNFDKKEVNDLTRFLAKLKSPVIIVVIFGCNKF